MIRKLAWVGLGVLLLTLAGCLIKDPSVDESVLSVVRIRPDEQLKAAPDGRCYELWFMDINDFNNPTEFTFTPIIRFQWDPVNFRTLDETGTDPIPLYTQTGNGMDIEKNFLDHFIVFYSIEPLNDPEPNNVNGPIMGLFLDVSGIPNLDLPSPLKINHEGTMQLDFQFAGLPTVESDVSVSMVAQSWNKRLTEEGDNVCWRGATEGMGLWFANPEIQNRIVEDTAGVAVDPNASEGRGTLFTRDIDENSDGRQFNIWIFPDHPESSWSNFDDVFSNRVPDLVYLDGVPQRQAGTFPPYAGGVNQLGSHPMTDNGSVVGYMYFPDTMPITPGGTDYPDTCFLRVDNPALSYSTNDTLLDYIGTPFADTNLIIRVFTTTWADTTVTPSLVSLPPHQIGFGLEYESWLIFDSVNNPDPRYQPLSMGRMTATDVMGNYFVDQISGDSISIPDGICDGAQTFDYGNPYTDEMYFDSNFAYPGEDFINNLPNGLTGPLDLFNLPGVDKVKIWITMEPLNVPQANFEDWEPNKPFSQLVMYVGEVLPDLESDTLRCDRGNTPLAPEVLSIPLHYRPISRNHDDLAEGNNWPTMKFFVSPPGQK